MENDPNNPNPSDTTQATDPAANPTDGNSPVNPNPQPQPAGDPNILQAYQQQLLHESRERARLARELEEARRPKEQPPTPAEEKEFFDTPKTVIRDLVRKEIQDAVAPFNQSIVQQQRASLIEGIKRQMRLQPAQFAYIDQVESLFDQIISGAQQIDANVAVAAYNTALGYFISQGGKLEAAQSSPAPTPNRGTPPMNPNPPHIRPSAPPAPASNGNKKLRQLTENEKKIARFNGMTDEQHIAWSDGIDDPKEVATISDEEIIKRVK